jgi:hypothetical protein
MSEVSMILKLLATEPYRSFTLVIILKYRERLYAHSQSAENEYLERLNGLNNEVNELKADRRRKKDQKKREKEEAVARLQHAAQKFLAVKAQDKRLLLKKEQEERSKKRLEEKILRNKLQMRQQENQNKKLAEVVKQNEASEKLRVEEIRAKGLDAIDRSVQNLRYIDPAMYKDAAAQSLLAYAQSVDFSVIKCAIFPPRFL